MTENIPHSSQKDMKRGDSREPLKEIHNEPHQSQAKHEKEKHVIPDDLADYDKLSKIGEGTYGVVYKAYQKGSNRLVALKRVPLHYEQGIPITTVREIALLKEVSHRNVVKLLDLIQKDATVYLVFEYLDMDLGKYMKRVGRPGLTLKHIKSFMHQLLNGLTYLHSHRILHRDMKPQNLLIDRSGKLSIADFGLSRAFGVPMRTFTSQVVTLWYRAPEILLGSPHYSTGVDMWSVGCIFAEMMIMQALFPGRTQIGELFCIFRIMGTPMEERWPGVSTLPDYNPNFPSWKQIPFKERFRSWPHNMELDDPAYELLETMLAYDPSQRISARTATRHPFFYDDRTILSL